MYTTPYYELRYDKEKGEQANNRLSNILTE